MSINFLDPASIPKFVNQLIKPHVFIPYSSKVRHRAIQRKGKRERWCTIEEIRDVYFVDISEFKQQILPEGFPNTTVWGYGGLVKDPQCGTVKYVQSSPGPTFEAVVGRPITVKWINKLSGSNMFPVDPTLHWANPNNMQMDPPKP